jgi:hypothetical protein
MYHMTSSSSLDLYDPEKYVTESGGGRRGGGVGVGDSYSYSYSQSFDARDDSPTFLPGPGSAGSNESSLSPAQFNAALGGSSNGGSSAVPAVPAGQAIGASGPAPVGSVKPPLEAVGAATTGSAAPASAGTTTTAAAAVHPGLKRRKSSIYIQAQASDSINESHPQQLNAYLEV